MSNISLRDQAYHSIYEQMLSGELVRGSVTSEIQLSEELKMSRTPVRAALQQLETEGFVRIVPKHGVLVLDTSAQRVSDVLEVIAALVLFAVIRVQLLDPDGLSGLSRELLGELETLASDAASESCTQQLCRFELKAIERIVALSHNQEMKETLRRSAARLYWTNNHRRWAAPYRGDMLIAIKQLLSRLCAPLAELQIVLQQYVHVLKRTWN
ncbi:GntR family transcriptional regulator [Paenibacillus sp. R14(2021)]|uniref:GntR family transcriptional regulator n=1 Tax=Paenibacillus sp. R14(2021) TaxID=2859228 RepID=UPI001C612E65|nr:GntR family transcriptional regulator [Paenibacillus sp. R14(2021)]